MSCGSPKRGRIASLQASNSHTYPLLSDAMQLFPGDHSRTILSEKTDILRCYVTTHYPMVLSHIPRLPWTALPCPPRPTISRTHCIPHVPNAPCSPCPLHLMSVTFTASATSATFSSTLTAAFPSAITRACCHPKHHFHQIMGPCSVRERLQCCKGWCIVDKQSMCEFK